MINKKKHSILIVDDDKNTRDSLANYLSDEYTTYKASDGSEALTLLREVKEIVLVLSDVDMPAMDGIELLHSIKDEKKDVKLIFVSSHYTGDSAPSVELSGAYGYLTKPIDLNHLTRALKEALSSQCSE